MKTRLGLSIIAAAIALAIAAPTPSAFAENTTKVTTAAKKKIVVHRKRHAARKRVAYPELEPYRSFGFVGEFPGACAYDRAAGRCMIDLGYGRCMPCERDGRF